MLTERTNAEEFIIKLTEFVDKYRSCEGEFDYYNRYCLEAIDYLDEFLDEVQKWPEEKELSDSALVELKSSDKYKNLSLIEKLEEEISILRKYDQYESLISPLEKIIELRSNIEYGRERDLDYDRLSLGGYNLNYEQKKHKDNYSLIITAYTQLNRPYKANLYYNKFKSKYPRAAKESEWQLTRIYY